MLRPTAFGAAAVAALVPAVIAFAQAPDQSKYPDLSGQWNRIGPNRWETGSQKAPLTPEYRAVYEANLNSAPFLPAMMQKVEGMIFDNHIPVCTETAMSALQMAPCLINGAPRSVLENR
jgi:hypothetical protein